MGESKMSEFAFGRSHGARDTLGRLEIKDA